MSLGGVRRESDVETVFAATPSGAYTDPDRDQMVTKVITVFAAFPKLK